MSFGLLERCWIVCLLVVGPNVQHLSIYYLVKNEDVAGTYCLVNVLQAKSSSVHLGGACTLEYTDSTLMIRSISQSLDGKERKMLNTARITYSTIELRNSVW